MAAESMSVRRFAFTRAVQPSKQTLISMLCLLLIFDETFNEFKSSQRDTNVLFVTDVYAHEHIDV